MEPKACLTYDAAWLKEDLPMRRALASAAGLGFLLVLGCAAEHPEGPWQPTAQPLAIGERFDAASAGSISGKVVWTGRLPEVPSYEVRTWNLDSKLGQPRFVRPNPHAPAIDRATGAVAGAVVFLRTVDPRISRPWDHAPVLVEQRERLLQVVQGKQRSSVGFVRLGDLITLVSHENVFNAVHASGAAYFTLAFPDADQALTRALRAKGRVELSSNAGWYWMRAHLFVTDHPYYTLTDTQGCFELSKVPPGRYQLVCWMPNWNEAGHDRDPESSLVTRVFFQPPMEQECEIVVAAGASANANFANHSALFKR
jgi:hypothetical protein